MDNWLYKLILRVDKNTTKFSTATKSQKHKIPLNFCEISCFCVFVASGI